MDAMIHRRAAGSCTASVHVGTSSCSPARRGRRAANGAHWVVDNRARRPAGTSREGIGEVGGFSFELANHKRIYMIETAQKGLAWLRLASGTAGTAPSSPTTTP